MKSYAHQILSQAIDAVVIIDERNTVTFFNQSAEKLWRCSAADVIGQNVNRLVPKEIRHCHDEYVGRNRRTGEDVIVGTSRDVQLERADGSVIWANLSISRIQQKGTITYAAFVKDVDEQYRNRARIEELLKQTSSQVKQLALVAEEANDSVIITDANGKVVWSNRAFTEISGYTFEEVAGHKPGDVLQGPDTDPATIRQIRSGLDRAERMRTEILNYHKNGTPYWIELSLSPVMGEDGEVTQFIAIERDITETKLRERELEAAQAQAEAANKAKSNFLANMSHEIRTPMNGIIGMAELLGETELSDEQRICSRTIIDSSNALLRIINDILDFSKVEADKITLRQEPFSLENLLHDVVSLLQPKAFENGIEICLDIPDDLPEVFEGDDGRMRQILLNLVGNAVKFTLHGHVEVTVSYDQTERDAPLRIAVTDTGIGIPKEKLETVFSAFEQVDDKASRQFEGTGLGLAITSQLIALMGGTISVSSIPGEGSTFTCALNLPVSDASIQGHVSPDALDFSASLAGRKVIVVDDLEINRAIFERRLAAWGMQVRCLSSGAELLDASESDLECDVAIFDYNMPDMTGEALFHAFQERHPGHDFPVILYSSSDQAADARRLRDMGFAAILLKPAPSALLARTLAEAVTPSEETIPQVQAHIPKTTDDHDMVFEGLRILVAEDNRTNQLVLRKMLKHTGAQISFSENGEQALRFYEEHRADLILMDMSMPVMSGIEATRHIRDFEGRNPGTAPCPIIALTANAMQADRDACLAAGMSDFLSKPVRKKELIAKLEAFAGRTKGGTENSRLAG